MAFDWKSVLGTVAPTLATALGGPLAGLATKAIVEAIGLPEGSTEAELAKTLQGASPDQLLALKKAESDFLVQMRQLDITLEQIDAGDRDSARKRAAEQNDWTPQVVGAALIIIWGIINYTLLTGAVKPAIAPELVGRILGMIDGATMMFLAWLYGTNRGSAKKDETIKRLSA